MLDRVLLAIDPAFFWSTTWGGKKEPLVRNNRKNAPHPETMKMFFVGAQRAVPVIGYTASLNWTNIWFYHYPIGRV